MAAGTTATREFLGWDRPPSVSAAAWIVERDASARLVDGSRRVVVTPSARAGRALLGALAEAAASRGLGLVPPLTITPGEIPGALLGPVEGAAPPMARRLAWAHALRSMPEAERAAIVRHAPDPDDLRAWGALAERFERAHEDLVGEGLLFDDVANRLAGRLAPPDEERRWLAAGRAQRGYERVLRDAGLVDAGIARLADPDPRPAPDAPALTLVATVELPRVTRELLGAHGDGVTVLVAAPASLADAFDALGALDVDRWAEAEIAIPDADVVPAPTPADQADAVLRALAALGPVETTDVALGAPDLATARGVGRALAALGGPAVRFGGGVGAGRTEPAHALGALGVYLERPTLAALTALVRSPAWFRVSQARVEAERPDLATTWLDLVDAYHESSVHGRLTGRWHAAPEATRAALDLALASAQDTMGELAPSLDPRSPARRAPLHAWAGAVSACFQGVYAGVELDRSAAGDHETLAALGELRGVLEEIASASSALGPAAGGFEMTASGAVGLVAARLNERTIPEAPGGGAIEALGWLELGFDPARHAVVAGFNEGVAPQSRPADALLPDALRTALGVSDDRSRLARDAYLLSALLASKETTRLIVPRRSASGDPLRPSRLLFHTGVEAAASRAARLFGGDDGPAPAPLHAFGRADAFADRPIVDPRVPRRMSVTSFGLYLASPRAFYLRHVLRLSERTPGPRELDPGRIGDLVHDAWRDFGLGEARDETDPGRVAHALDALVVSLAERRFGRSPDVAVRLQVELARARVREAAGWQAARRAAGWRIDRVEWAPEPDTVALVVDGDPMYLSGRIDRIDVHEGTGAWAVLDYKTGKTPSTRRPKAPDDWKDLQLPLYRTLIEPLGPPDDVGLGYVTIGKDPSASPLAMAPWDEDDLRGAHAVAAEVVRAVRRGEFEDVGRPPMRSGILSALCGEGLLTLDPLAPEDDGEEGP
jgi:ATP-dependent helicase/nuclease subunit B